MGRPPRTRRIAFQPRVELFKPAGVPASTLEVTPVDLDEMEAIRLVDDEGLDQAEAAERMGVSRATVGRILERAHRKIAHALVNGHALAIAEGDAPVEFIRGPRGMGRGRGRGRGRRCRGGRG